MIFQIRGTEKILTRKCAVLYSTQVELLSSELKQILEYYIKELSITEIEVLDNDGKSVGVDYYVEE